MTTDDTPTITVVTPTHDRAADPDLVAAVLGQRGAPPFEFVIVDDGSSDGTAAVADAVADPRVRWLRQERRGPAAARNAGAATARGEWLVFLDDDDRPDTDWLATLANGFAPDVDVVFAGYRTVDGAGRTWAHVEPRHSRLLAETVTEAAGAAALRRTAFVAVGGYLDRLRLSENTDLLVRVTGRAHAVARRCVHVPGTPLQVRWRPAAERPSLAPEVTLFTARWLRVRYPRQFAANRSDDLNYLRIATVAAARAGRWEDARQAAIASLRRSRSSRDLLRVVAAALPLVGRRVWRAGGYQRVSGSPQATGHETSIEARPVDRWFLPWEYQEAAPRPADPVEVRHWDKSPVVAWANRHAPEVRGCLLVDVLSRHDDPLAALVELGRTAASGAVVAELDRDTLDESALGPPADAGARRHWSSEGLALLAESAGFRIVRRAHRPATSAGRADGAGDRGERSARWTILHLAPAPADRR